MSGEMEVSCCHNWALGIESVPSATAEQAAPATAEWAGC